MTDFKAEDAIVDAYVRLKGTPEANALAVTLIENFFLPQNRLIEAQGWVDAITDNELKGPIDAEVKAAVKKSPITGIKRIPQNTTWETTDVSSRIVKSDDQQYHYDRIVKYSQVSESMLSDIDDVRVCPNEWVTFWAKMLFESLEEYGVLLTTLAVAVNDYIHAVLLKSEIVTAAPAAAEKPARRRLIDPPRNFLSDHPDMIKAIEHTNPQFFDAHCFGMLYGTETVSGVRSDTLLFTDMGILIFKSKLTGKVKEDFRTIYVQQVDHIEVGSETHTEQAGLVSTTTDYLTLKIVGKDYTQTTRYLYLGKNESEINQHQPYIMRVLNDISGTYQLIEGDSWVSSSGYSIGFGVIY